MPALARRLADSLPLHLLLLVGLTFALAGTPVPAGNEEHYLAVLRRMWDPSFLAGDWTFSTPLPDRWTFDAIFGALAQVLPLPVLGWGGRLATWTLSLWAILRIARRLAIPLPMAAAGVSLWLLLEQSLVGGEWMVAWFEAKAVAWVFLLHALDATMGGRWTRAGAFAGLAATFHPAVGVVGGGSLAIAVLAVHRPWRDLLRPALAGLACGLPGIVQAGLMVLGSEPSTTGDWRFLSTSFLRIHMDASTFDRGLLAALALSIAFTVAWCRRMRDNPAFRILAWLHLAPAALFAAGLAAHAAGAWHWMTLTPYRLLPVISLLAFCLSLASLASVAARQGTGYLAPLLAGGVLLCLPALPAQVRNVATRVGTAWRATDDSYGEAFDWIAANVPPGRIGLVPPWRGDAALRSLHGQVVHCAMPRYDRLSEWHDRVESLLGDVTDSETRDLGLPWKKAKDAWVALSRERILELARRYGASYLVSEATHAFPLAFQAGPVKVYFVDPLP